MSLLQSCQHRSRFAPKVEALEDRSLLSAISLGGGNIVTTGTVNNVTVTDDGQLVRVFSDNGFLSAFAEGTPITVTTIAPRSTNNVFYTLLGSSDTSSGPKLSSSLNVNFGSGPGFLNVLVTSAFNGVGNVGDLGNLSNVQISTTAARRALGTPASLTQENLTANSLGADAFLHMSDSRGSDSGRVQFFATLQGVQEPGSNLGLFFLDQSVNLVTGIADAQNIEAGAVARINVQGAGPSSFVAVSYRGQLQGSLFVTESGGTLNLPGVLPQGNDTLDLDYELAAGSTGDLFSQQTGGVNDRNLFHVIHKSAGDHPFVQASTRASGLLTRAQLSTGNLPTNVFVLPIGIEQVIPVN
jgi:hypothetical protein